MSRTFSKDEVALHNTPEDLWIIVLGNVYNVTEFQNRHPGGKKVLQEIAGKDATREFKKFHRKTILDHPSKMKLIVGTLDKTVEMGKDPKGSFFTKFFSRGKRRLESRGSEQVNMTETVVAASEQEVTTSNFKGVTIVSTSKQQEESMSKIEVVATTSTQEQQVGVMASKVEEMEKSVEKE